MAAGHTVPGPGAERDECWTSAHLLLLIQSRTPAQGIRALEARVGLPKSVNST